MNDTVTIPKAELVSLFELLDEAVQGWQLVSDGEIEAFDAIIAFKEKYGLD